MEQKATIRNLKDIKNKRVFLRVDHNVPQDDAGAITDDTRIVESLNTIKYCIDKGAKIILCSHLGRPKSKGDKKFSMKPIVERLQTYLPKVKITLVPDCIGSVVEKAIDGLKGGEIVYLENIRYYEEETANDPKFAEKLSELCDYYVNDAFGAAHRAHASTEGIAHYRSAVAGFLMEKEIKILGEAIDNPKRPLTIIFGGKKISDKIGVLENLLKIANNILIGGGMAYTFAKAAGGTIGNSVVDNESLDYCTQLLKRAKDKKVNLVVAHDCIVGDKFGPDAATRICDTDKIRDGWEGFGIGPDTVARFKPIIAESGTIIWCGPLGAFEVEKFAEGSREVANAVVASKAITIAGGGDTAAMMAKLGVGDKFTHISTGGGASLELLEGKNLPGIDILLSNEMKEI